MTFLITGAKVHTSPGRTVRGRLRTSGSTIVGHDVPVTEATVVDGSRASVVPLLVDTVFSAKSPPAPDSFDLVPGRPATLAVIRGTVSASSIRHMLVVDPADLITVLVEGRLVVRGRPIRVDGEGIATEDRRLGAWTDPGRDMTQYLTPDGRYSETRGGRRDAYTGTFWLDGDRITYLDDTGFWAFGQYHRGVLHHAGFVLRKD